MLEIEEKEKRLIKRLTNKTFNFDKRFKEGYYSANYFLKTRAIVQKYLQGNICTMQFFQRKDHVHVCGLDEVIALIRTFSNNPDEIKIEALNDGDLVDNGEPVLKITGRYEDWGFLESAIDGILSRRSAVCTHSFEVMEAVNGKKVLNMADRQDDPSNQKGDGYSSYVAGMRYFSTDAQGEWTGIKGGGTMPHALIELCQGDILKASDLYYKTYPHPVTALIDYHNNCVYDSVSLAKHLGRNLACVRADTSKALVDHYFDDKDTSSFDPHGVCKELVVAMRRELDKNGFSFVKICVSSSFNPTKIKDFEANKVPVDIYGVGSYLLNIDVGYTGDLVRLNGKKEAKEGREDIPSKRLQLVD
jgi:nicotinate phosphoribosyltransferase